jgi:putative inorganic carbon (hco3(-)) transporter
MIAAIRPIHALLAAPSLLYLAMLAAMLFRPPDVGFYHLDRILFLLLTGVVLTLILVSRRSIPWTAAVSWPMMGLLLLSLAQALAQPFDAQTWSLLAAKFIVPFVLFHLAAVVFEDARSIGSFEVFGLLVLAYLIFLAIASLAGATSLIYPKYILDESLGIHADRARGPFLQAAANGVTLILLGMLALNSFRRGRLRGVPALALLVTMPIAILATMTRAVWLSFAATTALLAFFGSTRRLKRACVGLMVAGMGGLLIAAGSGRLGESLGNRLEESGPVEIRSAVYSAGWELFLEKPVLGWGPNQMPVELARRMSDYHLDAFWAHNSYLEVLVENGIGGLMFYLWIFVGLYLLGRRKTGECVAAGSMFDREFRSLWPVMLGVYLFNAAFVVINYQFVNALMFTVAGILAGQNRRAAVRPDAL